MKTHGISRFDLAAYVRSCVQHLGVKTSAEKVRLWEKGNVPSANEFPAILDGLGATVDDLTVRRTLTMPRWAATKGGAA